MRCLREFLANPEPREIIEKCRQSRTVQGVLVQIDPRWMRAWRIGETYNPRYPDKGFDEASAQKRLWWGPGYTELFEGEFWRPWKPFRAIQEEDLRWRPRDIRFWDDNASETYSRWPIILRICLYPGGDRERGEPPLFPTNMGFRIRYEVRPVMRLFAGPRDKHRPLLGGISIGVNANDAGTMGGIVTDGSGRYFGLTCAHVVGPAKDVEQPARIDATGGIIGKVIGSELPSPYPSHTPRTTAHQRQHASKVDVALVEINDKTTPKLEILKMGKVKGLVEPDDIEQHEELQLTGRSSDWKIVEKAVVSPYYNIKNQKTGEEYCYENALIFRDATGAAAAQPGDSGAWLCKETDADYLWAGMVVGGDHQLGIAIAAHELKSWWESTPRNLCLSVR